jgi:hypothetical protein
MLFLDLSQKRDIFLVSGKEMDILEHIASEIPPLSHSSTLLVVKIN